MYFAAYPSPLGSLLLISDGENLTGLTFDELPRGGNNSDLPVFRETARWLDAWFRGESPDPKSLHLAPEGTDFQRLIWRILLEIPRGSLRTYGEIAREAAAYLGKEKMSPQAVGQAVGANPICIVIPCHRCVGTGGRLTGYAWGLEKKIALLRLEGQHHRYGDSWLTARGRKIHE